MDYLKKLDVTLIEGEFENPLKEQITSPHHIYRIFCAIKDRAQETLLAVYLFDDLTGAYDVLSLGSQSMTLLDTHDLFGRGFVLRARYFILVHNHPKGDSKPSPEDRAAIEQVIAASRHMKIAFLDFVIIGDGRYWSYAEENDLGDYSLGPGV